MPAPAPPPRSRPPAATAPARSGPVTERGQGPCLAQRAEARPHRHRSISSSRTRTPRRSTPWSGRCSTRPGPPPRSRPASPGASRSRSGSASAPSGSRSPCSPPPPRSARRAHGFQWEQADPLTTFDVRRFNAVRGYQAQQAREIRSCLKELRQLRKDALAECTAEPEPLPENEPESPPAARQRRRDGPLRQNEPTAGGTRGAKRTLSYASVAEGGGTQPLQGLGARGRRSERTQGTSPCAQRDPAPHPCEPERLSGASPQTRMGPGWNSRWIGLDVSKAWLDGYLPGVGPATSRQQRCRRHPRAGADAGRWHRLPGGDGGFRRLRADRPSRAAGARACWPRSSTRNGCATSPAAWAWKPRPTGSMPG